MRVPVFVYAAAVLFLFSLQEKEASAQLFTPSLYGSPISYGYEDSDDDFGVLLALLLLVARNKGGGGCCNNCNNVRTIPVPFPIPFPTNNPVITQSAVGDDDESIPQQSEVINVDTQNDDTQNSDTTINNSPVNNASSSSGSSSSSSSDTKPAKTT